MFGNETGALRALIATRESPSFMEGRMSSDTIALN
jgi:hypothetical protein